MGISTLIEKQQLRKECNMDNYIFSEKLVLHIMYADAEKSNSNLTH